MAQTALQLGLLASEKGLAQEAHGSFDKAIQWLGPVKPQSAVEPSHIWVQSHYFRAFCRVLDLNQPSLALADFEVIEAVCPGYVSYDLACLNARLGQFEKALDYLKLHLNSEYRLETAEIKADPDLKPLMKLKGWKALFKKA
jgi:tetratricopeptide (TPR) repeat protein